MLREFFKNWRNRLSFAFIFAAFFILVDEYVKEGYVLDLRDLVSWPLTHEQLFLSFIIIGISLGVRR